jgi:hypothetical protein
MTLTEFKDRYQKIAFNDDHSKRNRDHFLFQLDMQKNIFKVKKGITEMVVEGDIIEGATTVQITEDDLSDELKALMAMGIFNKDQAVGKSAVKTDREKRLIIKNPSMKKIYDDEGNVINVIMERT